MIRYVGKQREHGDYTITERYGLWATKDYIPITRVNDWFMRGRSEWTRFHAFVNCQDFALTANRADINNTEADLLIISKKQSMNFMKRVEKTAESIRSM